MLQSGAVVVPKKLCSASATWAQYAQRYHSTRSYSNQGPLVMLQARQSPFIVLRGLPTLMWPWAAVKGPPLPQTTAVWAAYAWMQRGHLRNSI